MKAISLLIKVAIKLEEHDNVLRDRDFYVIVLKVRIKSDRQKNVAKLLADRRFRKMA